MKLFLVLAVLVAAACAAPLDSDKDAQVLVNESDIDPAGNFQHSLKTSNGIEAQASGQLVQVGDETALRQQGSFSYIAPDGQVFQVTYTADENGFQPSGEHLPVPPQA